MDPLKTSEEIEKLKKDCEYHFNQAAAASSDKEKFQHFHKAFPFKIKGSPGLTDPFTTYFDHRFGLFWVGDRHGFLTLMTLQQLEYWLIEDNKNPGALREFVTGENLYTKQFSYTPTKEDSIDAFDTLKEMSKE